LCALLHGIRECLTGDLVIYITTCNDYCQIDKCAIADDCGCRNSALRVTIFLNVFWFLCGCGPGTDAEAPGSHAQHLRRGISGEPSSLDPATATDNFSTQVIQDLYEGLTRESSSGEVVPGVASSWEVDSTGTRYTFYLRANARWSNGKPVIAPDFVSSWQRVLDPKHSSPVSNELKLLRGAGEVISGLLPPTSLGVVAQSNDVLVVNLEQPATYFPQILSHTAAFPIYSDEGARSHTATLWVSNGPFILSNWLPGTTIELKRNNTYWDHANVHLDRVSYQVASDQNSQFAAYRSGQLDMTDTVPSNAIESLRKERPQELIIAPLLATAYYGLNLETPQLKGNLKLRKALSMTIDRRRLVSSLALGQTPAFGLVPPGTWSYEPQSWEWESLNDATRIAEAKRLYAEAGFSRDAPLHLRLLFNSSPSIKQTAILVAAMWKEELGVDTILSDEEFRVFLESRHDQHKWDVVRLAWTADYNDASNFLDTLRRDSPNNNTSYSNPRFDDFLDEAAKTNDQRIRGNLLAKAERLMLNDYPIMPLYFFVSKRLVKPYVIGVKPNALDRVGSKDISLLPH
jgi:oligopeptide transport system substrate-binding protein